METSPVVVSVSSQSTVPSPGAGVMVAETVVFVVGVTELEGKTCNAVEVGPGDTSRITSCVAGGPTASALASSMS